ncbi:MAG: asparaginase [Bacteroidota bacterium]
MYKITKIKTRANGREEEKVLVIYTGGTLGMVFDNKSQSLVPFDFEQIPDNLPEIARLDFEITVITLDNLLDSSNMKPQNWVELAEIIEKYYDSFDAFVILHGTDTMAYTASALSYILEGLNKPVILTGAQLPIGIARTDAKENFITALEISIAKKEGRPIISEVCIYFNSVLLRGNRSRKHESVQFNAFVSENYPPLATVGVTIDYNWPYLREFSFNSHLKVHKNLNENVLFLKLFPGISKNLVSNILNTSNLKGVVLETYGSGNAPTDEWFLEELGKAIATEILIINVSQCIGGKVAQGNYQTSRLLAEMGLISGEDITAEASITKLMMVLGQNLSYQASVNLLSQNLAGEIGSIK